MHSSLLTLSCTWRRHIGSLHIGVLMANLDPGNSCIFHLDVESFYVAVERVDNPALVQEWGCVPILRGARALQGSDTI